MYYLLTYNDNIEQNSSCLVYNQNSVLFFAMIFFLLIYSLIKFRIEINALNVEIKI